MSQTYHFEWRLAASPQALWPYVSDTQRLNAAIGLPEWKFTDRSTPGGAQRDGRFDYLGMIPIEWEEKPFEWVEGRELGVERLYRTGPILSLRSHVQLLPDEGGTRLMHSLEFEPRGFLWAPVARFELGVKTRRRLDEVYRWIDRHLGGSAATPFPQGRPVLVRGADARIADARPRLEIADGFPRHLVDRVLEHATRADDRSLARIRPLELADRWGADRVTLLRLFLAAVRRGLFSLAWDVICPSCRGAKVRVDDLGRLAEEAHCASCDVRIDTRAERSLELVFTVSSRVRAINVRSHCIGGPGNTPHVVLQRRIASGERAVLGVALTPGTYRLRGPGVASPAFLKASVGPIDGRVTIRLAGATLTPLEAEVSTVCEVELSNEDLRERILLLERADWHDDAVTVGRALSLQDFADLFPGQAPPPSLGLKVERLYVLALSTDLLGGLAHLDPDERARVGRDAMSLVVEAARAHGGALVLGDPDPPRGVILLAFVGPGPAVAGGLAILGALRRVADDREIPHLAPRAALDVSPCIVSSREARSALRGDAVLGSLALLAVAGSNSLLLPRAVADEAATEVVLKGERTSGAPPPGERRELVAYRVLSESAPSVRARRAEEGTQEDASPLRFEDLELGDEIGHGAASIVRRAKDLRNGRALAVKLQPAPDEKARARFERELRAYGKLDGVPGIAPLRGYGVHSGQLWIALDLIEGDNLERKLAREGPLPFRTAAQYLARVGRALHAAHTRGVVHRDVKPANIVLDSAGTTWLVDFGVATLVGEEAPGQGRYSGTMVYVAPEAFEEEPVMDARSDVYSLGVTLFELVSGRLPFSASNAGELIVQVMSESSPLLHEVARGASATAAAVARCALRKRPQDRYRNANEMALDLELLAQGQTPLHAPALGDDGETTFRFQGLFFRRGVAAAEREKSRSGDRAP